MEETLPKCIVCNSERFMTEANKDEMRWDCWGFNKHILKCIDCGLMFIYPQWTKEELNNLYDGYCDQKDFPGQKQAVRITKYLTKYIPNKKDYILEIGCGKGDNVKLLRKKHYKAIGIDKDPTYCNEEFLFHGDYRYCIFTNFKFIYAIQVFEHIDDPQNLINNIQNMLNDGGRFLLEFPNTEDPILSLYNIEAFKKFYYIPHHLFFWTPKTVQAFFDNLGVKIEIKLLQKYGIINHLRWAILKKPGNWHPHIFILDDIYKFIITHIFHKSDTIIVIGEKNE